MILAGGGFRHGQHLAFNQPYLEEIREELTADPAKGVSNEKRIPLMGENQQPLCNLFTSMLQHGGVDMERFSTATGILEGLTSRICGDAGSQHSDNPCLDEVKSCGESAPAANLPSLGFLHFGTFTAASGQPRGLLSFQHSGISDSQHTCPTFSASQR